MVSLLKSNYVKFVLVVYFRANNGLTYFLIFLPIVALIFDH